MDPQLRALKSLKLVFSYPDLDQIVPNKPGIYTLTGGRQIGKTTALKQWMAKLVEDGLPAEAISYFVGEMIYDHHALVRILDEELSTAGDPEWTRVIILDEVTYIRNWDQGIKFLADSGRLQNVVLVVTGSDLMVIQEARMRFPGRRGKAAIVDLHLNPLSFRQVVELRAPGVASTLSDVDGQIKLVSKPVLDQLEQLFLDYINHGGYLTAINDLVGIGQIQPATLATYADWVRLDVLKRNKSEERLREVLMALFTRLAGQVTWNNLAAELSIDHPATVASYVELLASLDVLFIQPAILENKLAAAPKKPRKIHFRDPFIGRALHSWLFSGTSRESPLEDSALVEGIVSTHIARSYPTFYIKAGGEVDVAFVQENRLRVVEVKWTTQTRPGDLRQVAKYDNAVIWRKHRDEARVGGVLCRHLPSALFLFE